MSSQDSSPRWHRSGNVRHDDSAHYATPFHSVLAGSYDDSETAGAIRQRFSIRGFNHVTLTVSDLKRSIDFYQGLFGFLVQGRQGSATAALRIGSPQPLGLTSNPSSGDRTPRIDHMCVGIDNSMPNAF